MTIKKGDLVMIVNPSPCCGSLRNIGFTFISEGTTKMVGVCESCRRLASATAVIVSDRDFVDIRRLKKIDPPAEGDSLPTRADIGVPA